MILKVGARAHAKLHASKLAMIHHGFRENGGGVKAGACDFHNFV